MFFLSILKALILGFTGAVEQSKYLFIPKSLNAACFSTLKSFKAYSSVLKYLVLNDTDFFSSFVLDIWCFPSMWKLTVSILGKHSCIISSFIFSLFFLPKKSY